MGTQINLVVKAQFTKLCFYLKIVSGSAFLVIFNPKGTLNRRHQERVKNVNKIRCYIVRCDTCWPIYALDLIYFSFPYRFLGGRDAKGFHPQMSTEET